MSIQVSCPNGHVLRVKDRFAGKSGCCPHCRAKVHVPLPERFSEEDVLGLLGPPPAIPADAAEPVEAAAYVHQEAWHSHGDYEKESGIALFGSSIHQRPKVCPSCHRRTSFSFSICPSCGTPLPASQVSPGSTFRSAGSGIQRDLPQGARPGEADSDGPDSLPQKTCVKCNHEVDARTHICPHCRTYLGMASGW